ncbi:GlcG/HbpS family heme-binding protein [Pelagibacterium montanilacus]|uniref:GlcG/HbpS family heme-binding protein n=1 Tax=Pelagibacterium montanilacus TaxID=2185280 RepID=UPI0013DF8756|nr:heme-binding protein [Pelagibacterium montanilacus]
MPLLELADRLASIIETQAQARRLLVTTCVIDAHGNIVLLRRMDGAILISLEMAQRKAYTAAAIGMDTEAITPLDQPGGALHTLSSVAGGRYVALGGGVCVVSGDRPIAGLGVSGASTQEDISLARAALAGISAEKS